MLYEYRWPGSVPPGAPQATAEGMRAEVLRMRFIENRVGTGTAPVHARRQALRAHPLRGLNRDEFAAFATENHLVPVRRSGPNAPYTLREIELALARHGPLWVAFGYGHIVAVVGTTNTDVLVHNPQGQPSESFPIANFNRLVINDPHAVLGLDPDRVQRPMDRNPYT